MSAAGPVSGDAAGVADEVVYDPFSPEVRRDPFPVYAQLRRHFRAYPLPQYDAWAVPRFDDVWRLSADRTTTIAEGPVFERAKLLDHGPALPQGPPTRPLGSYATIDPPVHTALRKASFGPFRPRSVAAIAEPLRADARRLLRVAMEGDRFDVVADYAAPAIAAATCRLLGIPTADSEALNHLVNRSLRRDGGTTGPSGEGAAARRELFAYLYDWARAQRGSGGVVDALAAVDAGGGGLTDEEIAVQVNTTLVGGIETLPKIAAGGVVQLSRHPDQRTELGRDPRLIGDACEEILRLEAPLQWVGRTLTADGEVAGAPARAGQRLFLLLASSNRDEREFRDPDRFDIHRRPDRSLVFGHGTHYCIGAASARAELHVLIEEFVGAVRDYEVLLDEATRPPSEFQLGYTSLPIHINR